MIFRTHFMASTQKTRQTTRNQNTVTLFPTDIYKAQYPSRSFIEALSREALLFRETDAAGLKWSKKNYLSGYTSYSSITDLAFRSSQFEKLKLWIDTHVEKYARSLEMNLGSGRLEISAFWINIMGQHCTHASHLHPLSTISGTVYLQVPKLSPGIKFEDPRLAMMMASPPRRLNARPENQRFIEVTPTPGTLVLFESWLKHEVPPNRSEQERISVSFNYDWLCV